MSISKSKMGLILFWFGLGLAAAAYLIQFISIPVGEPQVVAESVEDFAISQTAVQTYQKLGFPSWVIWTFSGVAAIGFLIWNTSND